MLLVAPNFIAADKTSRKSPKSAGKSVLRCHDLRETARNGAFFGRSGQICEWRRTRWRSGVNSNPRCRQALYGRNSGPSLAHYSARQKASVPERICSPGFGSAPALSDSLLARWRPMLGDVERKKASGSNPSDCLASLGGRARRAEAGRHPNLHRFATSPRR
jgi:hypothetical protein